MMPNVILFNGMSLDGRIDGFAVDLGQFYELAASRWREDATLVGSDTILRAEKDAPLEDEGAFLPSQKIQDDHRPLLVIPDSRGRVRFWHYLKALPYWRGYLALCSRSTPQDYLDYLEKRHVDFIIAGEDHVDLGKALEELSSCYGVRIVRADSGGTLNGILLRSGLVSEINVLIYPSLIGSATQNSIFRSSEISSPDEPIPLRLMHVERLKGDAVWLRYEVINERKSK